MHSGGELSLGARLNDFSRLTINNSRIDSLAINSQALGFLLGASSSLQGSKNTVNVQAQGASSAYGILIGDQGKAVLKNNAFQVSANNGNGVGADSESNSTLTLTDNTINAQSKNGDAYGVLGGGKGRITLNNSLIESETTDSVGVAYGVYLKNDSQATVSTSEIKALSTFGNTFGLFLYDASTLSLHNKSVVESFTRSNDPFYSSAAYGVLVRKTASLQASDSTIRSQNLGYDATGLLTLSGPINDSTLKQMTIQTISNKGTAVGVDSASNLMVTNSTITSVSNGEAAIGIKSPEDRLNIDNSVIEAEVSSGSGGAIGLDLLRFADVTLNASQIKTRSVNGLSIGATLGDNSVLILKNHSSIDSFASHGPASGVGLSWFTNLQASDSSITASSHGLYRAQGIMATEFSAISLAHTDIRVIANKGLAVGLTSTDFSTIALANSALNVTASKAFLESGKTTNIHFNGVGNSCTVNGKLVSCP